MRYNQAVVSNPLPGYVFKIPLYMSPCFVQLVWLSAVCSSEKGAQRADKLVKDKAVDLMVSMAEGVGVEPMKEPEDDGGDGGKATAPRGKRKLGLFTTVASFSKKPNKATKQLLASGVFGGSSSSKTDQNKGSAVVTTRKVYQQSSTASISASKVRARTTTQRGTCSNFGSRRIGRSTRTWRALLDFFCCPCRRLVPSSSRTSTPLGVSPPSLVADSTLSMRI